MKLTTFIRLDFQALLGPITVINFLNDPITWSVVPLVKLKILQFQPTYPPARYHGRHLFLLGRGQEGRGFSTSLAYSVNKLLLGKFFKDTSNFSHMTTYVPLARDLVLIVALQSSICNIFCKNRRELHSVEFFVYSCNPQVWE